MGIRGPAPAPTAIKLLRGTRKDRINLNQPQPPARVPPCPGWLSPEAKRLWRKIAPQLQAHRLLTEWDRESFAAYCEAAVQHQKACAIVAQGGILLKGYRGQLIKNPALQVARDTAQTMRGFAREFGLTPSARSSIDVGPILDDDAFDGLD
jgi:P27 family predicted phage terminase small subunit